MKEEFLKCVSNFDQENTIVKRKISHSLRVAEKMIESAKKLGWCKEDINLAYKIGILHDIGRFKQIEVQKEIGPKYDLDFDHGEYGANYLFKEGHIKEFPVEKKDYPIIEFAIRNHNKYKIEHTGDERKKDFAKLIRDADKLDILYLLSKGEIEKREDASEISVEVARAFEKRSCVEHKCVKTNNDDILSSFALVFDVNYPIFLKDMKESLEKLYERVCTKGNLKYMYDICNKYLEERIDEEC